MMMRILLSVIVLSLFAGEVWALSCERTAYDTRAFTTTAVADSWHPPVLEIRDDIFEPKSEGSKQYVYRYEVTYNARGSKLPISLTLLPNAIMIMNVGTVAGYRDIKPARYKCDKGSQELGQG